MRSLIGTHMAFAERAVSRVRPAVLVAGAVSVSLLVACGVPVDPSVRGIDSVPFGLMRTSTSTSSTTTTSTTIPVASTVVETTVVSSTVADPTIEPVPLYFLNGDRFVEERRSVAVDAPLFDIVFELVRGPVNPIVGTTFLTSVVNFGDVLDVRLEAGLATVELGEGFTSLPAGEQRRLIGQLVLTLASQRGVGQVRFTVSGNPLDVPQGDGTFGTDALSRDSFLSLVDASGDLSSPAADPVVSTELTAGATSTPLSNLLTTQVTKVPGASQTTRNVTQTG